MSKILIVYGTRYGATGEIAERIQNVLVDKGHDVHGLNLEQTKSKKWPSPENYNGIIVGSSIKMGMWKKEPKKFVKKNSEAIKNKKAGIFVTCGLAADPEEIPKAKIDYIEKILNKYEFSVDVYDAFGGVYDLTENSSLGKLNQKIIKMVAAEDPNIKLGELNDFRNWAQIESFAEEFDKLL